MIRLNKYLASCGVASRRKCDEMIKNGEVIINKKKVTELGTIVNEKKDEVIVAGKVVAMPNLFYIKMNKPKGYICSASDEHDRKIIFDLLPEKLKDVRLFSIGRLDYDSEGLILLTNDGDFAQRIAHPSHKKHKTYIVTVQGTILESELAVMRKGVVLPDKTRMPSAQVTNLGFKNNVTRLEIVIDEGQNRQIRKMFEALGRSIILLKRVEIDGVKLGGLLRGQCRDLTPEEIYILSK